MKKPLRLTDNDYLGLKTFLQFCGDGRDLWSELAEEFLRICGGGDVWFQLVFELSKEFGREQDPTPKPVASAAHLNPEQIARLAWMRLADCISWAIWVPRDIWIKFAREEGLNPYPVRVAQVYRFARSHPRGLLLWILYRERQRRGIKQGASCRRQLRQRFRWDGIKIDREAIYSRDRGLCGICGLPVPREDFHLDHKHPLVAGGEHSPTNVQVAHTRCNLEKQRRASR